MMTSNPKIALWSRVRSARRFSLPGAGATDKLLRYESQLDRELYRAMDQLERLQRQRKGENVPPPLNVCEFDSEKLAILRNEAKKFPGLNVGWATGAEHCQMVFHRCGGRRSDGGRRTNETLNSPPPKSAASYDFRALSASRGGIEKDVVAEYSGGFVPF